MKINQINELYKSDEGDKLALEELLPIAKRYINTKDPIILEIGCGYGRNLFALAHVPNSKVTGCDISLEELEKAKEKMKKHQINNVEMALQKDPYKLPFDDNVFDFIVLWQVLEHVLSKKGKKLLLDEAIRVCKNNGHILIETPNFLFPFDYHDNNLPLVHWLLSDKWRSKITKMIRKYSFPPSQYLNIYSLRKIFKKSPHLKSFKQKTVVYFEERYADIFKNLGGTRKGFKIILFLLYFPVYCILRILRLPGDTLTPSLRVVFEIKK